jgi:subtilase family serine protease
MMSERIIRGITGCAAAVAAILLLSSSSALAALLPGPGHSGLHHRAVCSASVPARTAHCDSLIVTNAQLKPMVTSGPAGYGPSDLQSAYNLTSASATNGGGRTVAIVDAYDDPNAEADLGVYRSQYGLPACTTANGCFRKVNQNGGTGYPASDSGWGQEISLDLDMVSAICPRCKILLVEANSPSTSNLAAAVDEAAALGATEISNSYGGGEYSGEVADQSHYDHPNVDVTVSAGDNGYGAQFPAASQYVTAVGGTSLSRASNSRGWSESAWTGTGSGCSAYIPKPAWQSDSGCPRRTIADVSADADPNTGVAVYDSFTGCSWFCFSPAGWAVFGGTSVAAPIVAAADALAGGRSPGTTFGSFPYNNPSLFWDVVGGNNGSCSPSYLCTAVAGYDGPTGMGSPNGVSPPQPPSAPANTRSPTITGTTSQGQTLTADPGAWTGSPSPTYTYQWQQCSTTCTNINGATAQTYTLQSSDVGKTIDVVVTAKNSVGTATATSAQTATIASTPADFTLSASPSSATMSQYGSTSYNVSIGSRGGFTGSVTLSVSGLPPGVTPTWANNPATPSSPAKLTLNGSYSAQPGTYSLTITGQASPNTHSTTVTLTITAGFF